MQLLAFVRADLASYHPQPGPSAGFAESNEPVYPKSLLLLRPLFETYELNPVNPAAQAAVPPPNDIDLDAWIVPPPESEATTSTVDIVKKLKKGKGKAKAKDANGSTVVSSRRHKSGEGSAVFKTPDVEETAEERAARERVCCSLLSRCWILSLTIHRQEPNVSSGNGKIRTTYLQTHLCALHRQKTSIPYP